MAENMIYLRVQYDGSIYMGAMAFDDAAFCRKLANLLSSQIGVSMKIIGDIDVSYML
jgi:hypothetical protein